MNLRIVQHNSFGGRLSVLSIVSVTVYAGVLFFGFIASQVRAGEGVRFDLPTFPSFQEMFFDGVHCAPWWAWSFVAFMLLCAVLWSREMLVSHQSHYPVKRLFVFAGLCLAGFMGAFVAHKNSLLSPFGFTSLVLILTCFVDLMRRTVSPAHLRLRRVMQSMLTTLTVLTILAVFCGWTCSVLPLALLTGGVAIRYINSSVRES